MPKQAVLLLAHGTPETVEQIPEYLRNVTSGRPLPASVVEEIQHRYSLIGHSPLTEITLEQARMVETALAEAGRPARVYVGMRNWRPYIPELPYQRRTLPPGYRGRGRGDAHRLHRRLGGSSAAH